jgi:glycosyltransferase involved in cell wall biosynthesis
VDLYKKTKSKRATPDNEKFTFYTIFQWTERKNPADLLRIFWHTFIGVPDVQLIIKTYLANHTDIEISKIMLEYGKIVCNFPLAKDCYTENKYPSVKFLTHMLSDEEMQQLHADGDCYISLHRGEGFGLPIVEAMAAGNPAIATNFYACEDYLTKYNSMPVSYQLEPVYNMPWICWYRGIQLWAQPNLMEASRYMMWAYQNREAVRDMGYNAQKTIEEKYHPSLIAKKITDALHETIRAKTGGE